MAEATLPLQKWKKAGEAVAVDEILIEIETDKVVLEVPAPSAGVGRDRASRWRRNGGTEQLIARIDTEAAAGASAPAATAAAASQPHLRPQPLRRRPPEQSGVAMPAAAKLMADNEPGRRKCRGLQQDGRVTKGDIAGRGGRGGAKSVPAPVAIPTGAHPPRCCRRCRWCRLTWA
ncbi:MAG: biotin/lipoyl-containing protein [Burkholderiaceae bacterium]